MAASSSRIRPRSTACQPCCATSASSVARFESRIWPGRERLAGLDQLVAGATARPTRSRGCTTHLAHADAGQHAEVAGAEHLAGFEHRVAGAQVVARRPHRLARRHLRLDGDARAVVEPARALDHHDGVGAVGHRRAGEDPHRLARPAAPARPGAPPRPPRRPAAPPATSGDAPADVRRPAPRTRPSRCWRTAARPPATSPSRPARTPPPPPSRSDRGSSGATRAEHVRLRVSERDQHGTTAQPMPCSRT